MQIKVIQFGLDDYNKSIELRDKILRKPLGLEYSSDFLAAEKDQFHIGIFSDDKILGILLLQIIDPKTLKMRQVAVDEHLQGTGIGRKLVEFSEEFAFHKGFRKITLHARKTAVPFYEKLNYNIIGEMFLEIGIEHFEMEKELVLN